MDILLQTKLYKPPYAGSLLPRPHLVALLDEALKRKLALVSAPAGFGKTTLLSEWLEQCNTPAAWLSLDEQDNDLDRFLRYFILTLQQIDRNLGGAALDSLHSRSKPDIEPLITGLINELPQTRENLVVVLDDYHVITLPDIQQALLFLVEHQPPNFHMVLSSRSDPPWPLARLRGRDELVEIRLQELRFTTAETTALLNDIKGLGLSQANISLLDRRTEGWAAGLQLAAASLRGNNNIERFIQAFSGSHRYVMDYLVEEVLSQQSASMQAFLLQTSILDRLCATLCDALTGMGNSQQVLSDLEQKNLFLIPLDDQRRWYRYHHLFADLLRKRLQETGAETVDLLHRKASTWYRQNGLPVDAIHHALQTGEIEPITQLTEEMTVFKMDNQDLNLLRRWLDDLPKQVKEQEPWLIVARAWICTNRGNFDEAEACLEEIETAASDPAISQPVHTRIRGHVAALRSYLAELREDPASALHQAETAISLLPEDDIILRAFVSIRRANSLAWAGKLDEAIAAYRQTGETCQRAGDAQTAITALSEMAAVQMTAGKLDLAESNIALVVQYAGKQAGRDGKPNPAAGILYRHLSYIQYERNELTAAAHSAHQAVRICQEWGNREAYLFSFYALAKVQFAQREFAQLEDTCQQIKHIASRISAETLQFTKNWTLYFQLKQGETDEAEAWSAELGLGARDVFEFYQRAEYENYARLLLATGSLVESLQVTELLLDNALKSGAEMLVITYNMLRAEILYKMRRSEEAVKSVGKALAVASSGGYVRTILDVGNTLEDLLKATLVRGVQAQTARQFLESVELETIQPTSGKLHTLSLPDPLSPRELEVLRFLKTDLTTPEIAAELVVSVSTVRSHIKNIYSKLDVHSRYEAADRASALGLL